MRRPLDILKTFPEYNKEEVHARWRESVDSLDMKVVVLDDDPTGVQTVHGIHVYTGWSKETLAEALRQKERMFFVLTNSRGLNASQTERLHREIAENLSQASKETGVDFVVISRSDSTLRGHYPMETLTLKDTLEKETGKRIDGEIIMPFFLQGGRYTIDDTHYVAMEDALVPAGETEFAKDKTFYYRSSNLKDWVEEKTGGVFPASGVTSITMNELRSRDFTAMEQKLEALSGFSKLIVNAVSDEDAETFVTALIPQLKSGKRFLFRSAAALARALGGVENRGLLSREELLDGESKNGGLVVVGSHVQKTGRQLEALMRNQSLDFLELNQHLALDEAAFKAECERAKNHMNKSVAEGKTVVLYTRRERFDLNTGNPEDELKLAMTISDAVTGIVSGLKVRPGFLIAKGGITSSEIGTKALLVKRALVKGQILPGVPVWQLDEDSRFPGLRYVIFPGNVGNDNALLEAVLKFTEQNS